MDRISLYHIMAKLISIIVIKLQSVDENVSNFLIFFEMTSQASKNHDWQVSVREFKPQVR